MTGESIHVLFVEDNAGDVRLVMEMLRDEGPGEFSVSPANTLDAALAALARPNAGFDVILLDLSLPDESGLETINRVLATDPDAVVVVMTGLGDEELGRMAMQAGAQDYLVKGHVDGPMLRRALRFAIERQDVRRRLEDLSLKDDLTGLHNRRAFLELATQQLRLARRGRAACALLFMDLDRLKFVNDTYGHAEGNRALVDAAGVLRDCFRQSDIVARLGGDEFAAFAVTAIDWDAGLIRQRIETVLARVNGDHSRPYRLGFSMGIVTSTAGDETPIELLLERADALMYEEKHLRDQIRT
jgi:diguanylate cyclase (GGDEF)-like protein